MARRSFVEVPYQYGDSRYGFALMQTRNGVEEAIQPVALWELDTTTGLYMPPGESTSPKKPRVDASGSAVDVIDKAARLLGKISADDGAIAALGALAAAAVTDPAASATVIALLKGLLKQLQGTGTGAAPVTLSGSIVQTDVATNVSVAAGGYANIPWSALTQYVSAGGYKSACVMVKWDASFTNSLQLGFLDSTGTSVGSSETLVASGQRRDLVSPNFSIQRAAKFRVILYNGDTVSHTATRCELHMFAN